MLTKTGPNEVRGSDGYVVRRASRNDVVYEDERGAVHVEVEPGDGLAVYSASVRTRTKPDGDEEELAATERKIVLARVSGALSFLGVQHVIE